MKRRLIATGFLCLLAGCANYPGQRTKAEWNAPPAAEQQRLLTARGREAAEQNGHSNSSRRECGRERKKPNVDPGLRPSDVVTVGMMQHRLRFRNKPLPPQIQFPSNKASHALARQPTFDEALGLRAMILNQTGKTAESMKLLKEGVASNPQSLALRTRASHPVPRASHPAPLLPRHGRK